MFLNKLLFPLYIKFLISSCNYLALYNIVCVFLLAFTWVGYYVLSMYVVVFYIYYVHIKINISHDIRSRKKAVGLTVEIFMNLSPPQASEIGLLSENNKVNWSFFYLVIYFYLFHVESFILCKCKNHNKIIKFLCSFWELVCRD